ncbi:hypothetical protein HY932_00925 [Candidatus Falkowbacteria bacterium]|nr:hypothetical protein [Candidatus Falkowbacteria bacterium]
MKKFYRLILGRALWIVWQYKWLWPLGLAAVFVSAGSIYDFLLRIFDNLLSGVSPVFSLMEYWSTNLFSWMSLLSVSAWLGGTGPLWFELIVGFLMLICLLVVLVLAIVCQVGLIKSVIALDKAKRTTPNQAIQSGVKLFWPALKFNILSKVFLIALLFGFSWVISLVALNNSLLDLVMYAAAFVFLVLAVITVHFITIFGIASLVLKKTDVVHAVKNAFRLFSKNIVLNLEMGLILFFINIVVGLAGVIAIIVVEAPLILIYMLSTLLSWNLLALIFSILMLIVFVVILLVLVAWLSTFQLASWVILFDELEANRGEAKVSRLTAHLIKRLTRKRK